MVGKTMGELYDYSCSFFKNKTALVFGQVRVTFGDLREKSLRLANALLGIGLGKGDRVAILMPNCPEVVMADYAFSKTGIVRIPLATYHQAGNLIMMLEETESRALLYHESFLPLVRQIKKKLPHLQGICCPAGEEGDVPLGEWNLRRLIAEGGLAEIEVSVTEKDLYNVNYTGGTTGVSKGVVRTHRTYVSSVMMELIEGEIRENETYLAVTPLTHAAGALLLPAFLRGGSCVILPGFNPAQFLQTVQREKVTFSFMVPTMIYNLLDHPDVGKYDTSSLRTIIYGAAPMSPERLKEAIQIFGPIFTQYYAQVEAVMPVTLLRKQEHIVAGDAKGVARLSSCGRPSIAYRLKLVDEQGRDVPVGQPGEILVQGPSVMVGYLKRPELTAETLRDGWLHTGDIARMDEDGYIYIVDRKKDMIVSGGFNIYPKEVEDVLYEHPAVAMAAVIGVPHPKWGEEVKAVVVLKPGAAATAEQLIAFCKERKGSLISPKTVDFAERIPVTGLGKPDKKALKEPYWKGRDRSIA